MKKYTLLGLIILNVANSLSQDSKRNLSIGCFFQPVIAYRMISYDNDVYVGYFDTNKPKYGYQIGLDINYEINKTFQIHTGVVYMVKGFDNLSSRENAGLSAPIPSDWLKLETKNSFHYISFPVKMEYSFIRSNRIRIGLNGGIGGEIFLSGFSEENNYFTDRVERNKYNLSDQTKHINITAIIGIGFYYNLPKNIELFIQPNYDISILSLYKEDSSVRTRLWDLGIRAGINYKF